MVDLPIIILGAGGHAKVIINTLLVLGANILGITDPDPRTHGKKVLDTLVLGGDDCLSDHPVGSVGLVNGVGSTGQIVARRKLYNRFKEMGYEFANVIHPSAVLAPDVVLDEAVQVMAGTVIQPGAFIGKNTIINTRASIDHDCVIGNHSHIAPGATLSGGISVGEAVHVGVGATIIQGIKIGAESTVAAGSLVLRDVTEASTVYGVPAKEK